MRYPSTPYPSASTPEIERGSQAGGLAILVIAILVLLALYLGWLQLFQNRELGDWARRQQDRITIIPGKRGNLLDRNGILLNQSVPSYSLALRIEQLRDPRDTQNRTLDKIATTVSELAAYLGPHYYHQRPTRQEARRHIRQSTPLPFVLWKDIDRATIDLWAARRQDFPGTELLLSWKRHYAFPESASLLRGKTGFDTPVYLPDIQHYNLETLDLTGRSGLEAALNSKLSGVAGYEQMRIDVMAYRHELLHHSPAQNGYDVRLTLDLGLQRIIEGLLRKERLQGAVVVMGLNGSEVLAAVSEPSQPLDAEGQAADGTLFNRVLGGIYPPGSTLKPLVCIEALQHHLLTPTETLNCPGYYPLPDGRQLACSRHSGHGPIALEQALAFSCNTYFCVLGDRLGPLFNRIGESAGLGSLPGTELRKQEKAGLRFTPAWVERNRPTLPRWTVGDSANASIGQGAWLVTPMQMLIALSAVVTGKRHQPTFVQGDYQQPAEQLDWDEEKLLYIRRGMLGCTQYGTGKSMQIPGYQVLGKTGTAEVGGGKSPHALAFAALPAESPRLACFCIIEHGGGGGKVAGPIVQQSLKAALDRGL